MKKTMLIFIAFIFAIGLYSCDDKNDLNKTHELTEEEKEEIRRQDSIKAEQMSGIKADLILKYDFEIKISGTLYDGGTLEIDLTSIAATFEISVDELLLGIEGEGIDIKPFAIEGSTYADNATASTTNAPWGHWWDVNGDVISWGEDAMVFAEFNPEEGTFFIGQYPGHLTPNQKITIIEALRYDEKRVAIQITITAVEKEKVEATIVDTQELTINVTPRSSYDLDPVEFNLDKALADLGISSTEDVEFVGLKDDGTFANEYTGDASLKSYWYDMNGFVGSWGDDASVYATYGEFEDNVIGIGQFPAHLSSGDNIEIQYGMIANNKIVVFKITVNVIAYEDPETELEGDAKHTTHEVSLSKAYTDDYASVTYDVLDILRDAFRKTTYQIHQAILDGELKVYQGEITEEEPAYTADVPGYWLKEDGTVGGWGESVMWLSIGHSETELYLFGGNHPGNAEENTEINTKYIVTFNGGSVTFDINFKLSNE